MFENKFTKWHAVIYAGFVAVFGTLTYVALSSSPGSPDTPILWTTFCTATGPMLGAIARGGQSCCLQFSLGLLPYCAAFLAFGTICQLIRFPFTRFEMPVRYLLWSLGLFGWFAGIPISFAHAFG